MLEHTFVICAYKESQYLEACIRSCLNQVSVLEGQSQVILYTSTPNDTISDLCDKYNLQMFQAPGGSIGKDWNNALSFADTEYATIAHQDDIYLPNYGSKILAEFHKKENANIVFSDYAENDTQGNLRARNINLKIKTAGLHLMNLFHWKNYQRRVYAFGNFICCPAVSYNLKRLKDFQFNEEMKMAVDWDAWERIMRMEGRVCYVSERLMYHRIHEESETTTTTRDHSREQEEFEMYQRYWGTKIAKLLMKFYVYNQKSNV